MFIKIAIFAIVFVVVGLPVYAIVRKLWVAGKEEEAMDRLKKDLLDDVDSELKTGARPQQKEREREC